MGKRQELHERFDRLEMAGRDVAVKSAVWGLFGWVGNILFTRPPPDVRTNGGRRLLNLGCGRNRAQGWVNADFFRFHEKILHRESAPDWMLDITRPFNCPDAHWDGVFAEHTNEHLTYTQNLNLLGEIHRTLKSGSLLRVVAPDVDRYVRFQELQAEFPKFSQFVTLPEAISNVSQCHRHKSVWNPGLMREVLDAIGFTGIREVRFREGADPDLLIDSRKRLWESFYLEGMKP